MAGKIKTIINSVTQNNLLTVLSYSPPPPLNIKYYFYALLFVIFDIETLFLFPWAARYGVWTKEFGLMFFFSMLSFLVIVTFGYVYAWKKGDLEWD